MNRIVENLAIVALSAVFASITNTVIGATAVQKATLNGTLEFSTNAVDRVNCG